MRDVTRRLKLTAVAIAAVSPLMFAQQGTPAPADGRDSRRSR